MTDVTDTAQPIAWIRAEESLLPAGERWFEDPYAKLFAGAGASTPVAQRMASIPAFRQSVRVRTRYLDDAVRAALDRGIRQLVLLGAGFDCRALRMPEIAACGAIVMEVDFPGQLALKRDRLASAGVRIPDHVTQVACDLTSPSAEASLTSALGAAGHRADEPTFFLWEGVLGYLDDEACDRTLALVGALAGPGGRLAFNYQQGRFVDGDLPRRLGVAGLTVLDDADSATLLRGYQPGEPPPGLDRFRLLTAERDGARGITTSPRDHGNN